MLTTEQLIEKFTQDIRSATKTEMLARLTIQMGGFGRHSNDVIFTKGDRDTRAMPDIKPAKKERRKAPVQLCPVPKCKHRAAPAFGMVCGDHRRSRTKRGRTPQEAPRPTTRRPQIKKFREARRAAAK